MVASSARNESQDYTPRVHESSGRVVGSVIERDRALPVQQRGTNNNDTGNLHCQYTGEMVPVAMVVSK